MSGFSGTAGGRTHTTAGFPPGVEFLTSPAGKAVVYVSTWSDQTANGGCSRRRLCRWLALVALLLACASAAAATGLAWRVHNDKGKPSYLLGSLHVGVAKMYPLPAAVQSAFAQADALVVEADIVNADYDALASKIYKLGLYHDGSSLRQHLTEEQWRALTRTLAAVRIPAGIVAPQKPWMAYNTLTGAELTHWGYSGELGVDRHFMERANKQGKKIIELEGLLWQLKLLAGLDEQDQIDMLMDSANHVQRDRRAIADMVDAWTAGDEPKLARLFDKGFGETPRQVRNELIGKRNATMAEHIRELFKDGRSYFVVVGAGHLVGNDSVVARLRHTGYTVERLGADRQ